MDQRVVNLLFLMQFCMMCFTLGRHIGHETIRVTQRSPHPRARRDQGPNGFTPAILTGDDFPAEIEFTLHLRDGDKKLLLSKQLTPYDVIVNDDNGEEITFEQELVQFAVYQDIATHSNMIVDCSHLTDICTLQGTFHHMGQKWNLNAMDKKGDSYNATQLISDFDPSHVSTVNSPRRNKRASELYHEVLEDLKNGGQNLQKRLIVQSTCNILETEVYADYTVIDYYLARESGYPSDPIAEQLAQCELYRHYLALFGEIDLRFKCLIECGICLRVFLKRITIQFTQGTSWSNAPSADSVLNSVPGLLKCGELPNLNTDVKICTTKADLELNNINFRAVGFEGVICNTMFSSFQAFVVEDLGDDQDLIVASILLFEFGAEFDSATLDPACNSSFQFIGSQFDDPPFIAGTETNPWLFSNCSKEQLIAILDSFDAANSNCLKDGSVSDSEFENYADNIPLPGKIFNLNYQCQLTYGLDSFATIGPGETSIFDVDDICFRGVYCDVAGNNTFRSRVYNGSPCGCKEICIKNECVREFNVPLGGDCLGCCECSDDNAICDCETRTCVCDEGFYDSNLAQENGTCVPLVRNNDSCPFDEACEDANAECDDDTNLCVCIDGWVLRGGVCVRFCDNNTLPDVANGMWIPQDNIEGSIANLQCDDGYRPTSIETCRVCGADGNFCGGGGDASTFVECDRDCGCPPETVNGALIVTDEGETCATCRGALAALMCADGYTAQATAILCQNTTQGWSNLMETCALIECDPATLPAVDNGSFDVQGTTPGSKAVLNCNENYSPNPMDTVAVCQIGGAWSSITANCVFDCGVPDSTDTESYVLDTGSTLLDATATIRCCVGLVPAQTTITCTEPDGWQDLSKAKCRGCPDDTWIRRENTCYLFQNGDVTNTAANATCNSFDTCLYDSNLLKLDSTEEREFIRQQALAFSPQPQTCFWLGLYQVGPMDGSEVWLPSNQAIDPAVEDWNNNAQSMEPNSDTQICSSLFKGFNYRWTDIECANIFNSDTDGRECFNLCEIDL